MKSDARRMTPEKLARLSRENVEYWLLHEMHQRAQDVDASLIQQALARVAPVSEADTEQAHLSLLMFHCEHDAQIAARRRRRHRAQAVALVAMLLSLMTAVGFTLGVNIWQVAYEWASEQLLMQLRPNNGAISPAGDVTGSGYIADVWGDAVYEMMMENDIHVRLPMWKPEGFVLEGVQSRQVDEYMLLFTAEYSSQDGRSMALSLRTVSNIDPSMFLEAKLEADENYQAEFLADGKALYVMSNNHATTLTWVDGTTCLTISGNISSADATMLADSLKTQ